MDMFFSLSFCNDLFCQEVWEKGHSIPGENSFPAKRALKVILRHDATLDPLSFLNDLVFIFFGWYCIEVNENRGDSLEYMLILHQKVEKIIIIEQIIALGMYST